MGILKCGTIARSDLTSIRSMRASNRVFFALWPPLVMISLTWSLISVSSSRVGAVGGASRSNLELGFAAAELLGLVFEAGQPGLNVGIFVVERAAFEGGEVTVERGGSGSGPAHRYRPAVPPLPDQP
jgi:hypothetical protein